MVPITRKTPCRQCNLSAFCVRPIPSYLCLHSCRSFMLSLPSHPWTWSRSRLGPCAWVSVAYLRPAIFATLWLCFPLFSWCSPYLKELKHLLSVSELPDASCLLLQMLHFTDLKFVYGAYLLWSYLFSTVLEVMLNFPLVLVVESSVLISPQFSFSLSLLHRLDWIPDPLHYSWFQPGPICLFFRKNITCHGFSQAKDPSFP